MDFERPGFAAKVVSLAVVATIVVVFALLAWFYATRPTPWTVYLTLGVVALALVGRVMLLTTRKHQRL